MVLDFLRIHFNLCWQKINSVVSDYICARIHCHPPTQKCKRVEEEGLNQSTDRPSNRSKLSNTAKGQKLLIHPHWHYTDTTLALQQMDRTEIWFVYWGCDTHTINWKCSCDSEDGSDDGSDKLRSTPRRLWVINPGRKSNQWRTTRKQLDRILWANFGQGI